MSTVLSVLEVGYLLVLRVLIRGDGSTTSFFFSIRIIDRL